ncbi:hypothetical protein JB92DRAFT_2912643 [Gautieria morchelliformis]|nr:hypothetical protein JB92DRAFT_2912643 [Gautieria morchelliformis]
MRCRRTLLLTGTSHVVRSSPALVVTVSFPLHVHLGSCGCSIVRLRYRTAVALGLTHPGLSPPLRNAHHRHIHPTCVSKLTCTSPSVQGRALLVGGRCR